MLKRLLVAVLVTGLAWSQVECALAKKDLGPTYGGLEYFGSSQISRLELEKHLALKPNASEETVLRAVNRLKEQLDKRRLQASVDVTVEGDKCFVTVDVVETTGSSVPVRKIISPHRIYLSSGLPFSILDQLFQRIQTLKQDGRTTSESVVDGIKHYTDEPCDQFAKKLSQVVPPMRGEFLEVITYEPDPVMRSKAVEVLNWDPHLAQDCVFLMPEVDDGSEQVRASVCRFIYPRIKELPDNFPIPDLVEVFSHELSRPSHLDRLLALRCLNEIVRTRPFTAKAIIEVDGERLKQLAADSLLSSIKEPAEQLLSSASHLPEPAPSRKNVQINEF